MQWSKVRLARFRKSLVRMLQVANVFFSIVVVSEQLRKNPRTRQKSANLDAEGKITCSTCSSAISVYERMYVIYFPQNESGEENGVLLFPIPIHEIYEIIHQRLNTIMCWRFIVPHPHRARSVFPGVRMQATNRVLI